MWGLSIFTQGYVVWNSNEARLECSKEIPICIIYT